MPGGGSGFEQVGALTGYEISTLELLDILWLAGRLPRDGSAPLAALVAQQPAPHRGKEDMPGARHPDDAAPEGAGRAPDAPHRSGPAPRQRSPSRLVGALHAAASAGGAPEFAAAAHPERRDAGALPVRVPEGKALGHEELRLSRALRPLKQRWPRHDRQELDDVATVTAMAETGLPDVVTRPARERWLDLTLLVDDGVSMLLWRRLVSELRSLFEQLGAFRDVRVHGLDSRSPARPRLRARPFDPDPAQLSPAAVTDPSGRSLILVISDGVGSCWRDGTLHGALERWARRGPTGVVHALPAHMWSGSGLRAEPWRVTTRRRGAANDTWDVTNALLPAGLADDFRGVPVPVLEPRRAAVAAWARLVASPGASAELPLLAPPTAPGVRPAADTRTADAADAVLRFRDAASGPAYRLAAHLAAVSPITVPVMRLVLSSVPWPAETSHLAEVFLGGLMRRAGPADDAPPQHRSFEFVPGAQEILLDTAPPIELLRTTRAVTERLARLVGRSPDFPAWLAHPSGTGELLPGTRPFAWLEDRLLTHLGARPMAPVRALPPETYEEAWLPDALRAAPSWLPLRVHDLRSLGPYNLRLRGEAGGVPSAYIGADETGAEALLRVSPTFNSPMARELLGVEWQALRRMDGVYAPEVLDSDLEGAQPWIALRLDRLSTELPAPTLRALLHAAGPLHDSPLFPWLGWHLARAVLRCHRKNIVHGALAPGTVLVTEETIRILEWTSARIDGQSSESPLAVPTGSPHRAPEATAWGESRIAAGDVYALGTILVDAATGRSWRWYRRDALLTQEGFLRLDGGLRDILLRCVDEEPEARPTAAEVAEAFAGHLPESVTRGGEDDTPTAPPAPAGPAAGHPDEDAEHDRLLATVRAPLRRPLHIALLALKDRVGCTTTTTVLGALLAEQRREPVLAIDADRHAGGHIRIARRVYRNTEARLTDLAQDAGRVRDADDFRMFMSQHRSGLLVLANDSVNRAGPPGQFSDGDYAQVAELAQRYCAVTLADTDRFPQAVLHHTDRVVIVTRADPAGLTHAQQSMDRLLTLGLPHLAADAVVVLNHSRPEAGWTLNPASVHALASRCRSVVMVPRDSHLATGSVVELSWLAPETYRAYLRLAALLLEGR
ncbi:SAV_2336 N-terminal domain-related protein [Streptomyces rimosus]|uniref:SAV_2336 N-terminal domain-related protein n=1 Tax=Streptomyces rimosus TaxID=1927 RepID=UPI0004C9ADE8|nr:SAV_2336 N-terminal domain-related protein [Streptomyces rimosus]